MEASLKVLHLIHFTVNLPEDITFIVSCSFTTELSHSAHFSRYLKKTNCPHQPQVWLATLPSTKLLVVQSCPTLCDPKDRSPPGSSVQGDSPGKNTGVGCHALLQAVFPTQGLNPGLPYCRQILYHLSHQGGPPLKAPSYSKLSIVSVEPQLCLVLLTPEQGALYWCTGMWGFLVRKFCHCTKFKEHNNTFNKMKQPFIHPPPKLF